MSGFQKAERRRVKIKLAITGPSGSGKTYSALAIASGLGKKIAVIDTENGSAALYSDKFEFDTKEIEAPYTVEKHVSAIREAVEAGYDVLVMDSITHVWKGAGGLLDEKTKLDQRPGSNSFTNWAGITKKHEAFLADVLHSDIHLIATMRSKQDYVVERNEKGKSEPKKVGLAPEQRENVEYEFAVVFDMGMDHSAAVSKDRTGLFDGQIFTPSKKTGEKILKYLEAGAEPVPKKDPPTENLTTRDNEFQLPTNPPPYQGEQRFGKGKAEQRLEVPRSILGNWILPWKKSPHFGKPLRDIPGDDLFKVLEWGREKLAANDLVFDSGKGVAHIQEYLIETGDLMPDERVLPLRD